MDAIRGFNFSCAIGCLVTVVLLLLFKHVTTSRTKRKLPPGPSFALPFLGHLLQLGRKPHLTFSKWRKLYGPLVSWKMANMNAVVVSDAKLLKELFSREGTTNRIRNIIFDLHADHKGIGTSEGRVWTEQRSFALKALHTLSKGGTLEALILEEGLRLVKFFKQQANSPVELSEVFMGALLNTLWALISGDHHDWIENPELPHVKIVSEFGIAANHTVETGLLFAPWLRHVIPDSSGFTEFIKTSDRFKKLANDTVQSHVNMNGVTMERTHDFIGEFLAHAEVVTDPQSSFFGQVGLSNLAMDLLDLMIGGAETTSSTLEFAILYLATHPRVQVEIQEELDSVIGSRLPSMSDRLPYTEAVILETLRRSSVIPMGIPHLTTAELEFHGYTIPRGTILFADIFGIHMNSDKWTDPEAFRPERFLNEEKTGVIRHEALIPFSVGRRNCIGEAMGKNTLLLVVACLMQHFTLETPCAPRNVDLDDTVIGFVMKPKPFKVVFKLRK